mmetsp:Transcript_2806/g.8234  ORF Transcript_2806/g.8234 Transcript_2806/m.8234 type:complete len:228 (-) Transcript_2806:3573-4256(-)
MAQRWRTTVAVMPASSRGGRQGQGQVLLGGLATWRRCPPCRNWTSRTPRRPSRGRRMGWIGRVASGGMPPAAPCGAPPASAPCGCTTSTPPLPRLGRMHSRMPLPSTRTGAARCWRRRPSRRTHSWQPCSPPRAPPRPAPAETPQLPGERPQCQMGTGTHPTPLRLPAAAGEKRRSRTPSAAGGPRSGLALPQRRIAPAVGGFPRKAAPGPRATGAASVVGVARAVA